jgi:hypothetical protein
MNPSGDGLKDHGQQWSSPSDDQKAILSGEGRSFEEALKNAQDLYLNQLMSLKIPTRTESLYQRPPVWKDK